MTRLPAAVVLVYLMVAYWRITLVVLGVTLVWVVISEALPAPGSGRGDSG